MYGFHFSEHPADRLFRKSSCSDHGSNLIRVFFSSRSRVSQDMLDYVPPGWTPERLAAATADELLQLDYSVRLLSLQECAWLMVGRRST